MKPSLDEGPWTPVIIERPTEEDPMYCAYNLEEAYIFVMGSNSTLESAMQSYKYNLEDMEDLVKENPKYPEKEATLNYLNLPPRFFFIRGDQEDG